MDVFGETNSSRLRKEYTIGQKRREQNLSPRRGLTTRSFQKDRFANAPQNASRFAASDVVVAPLEADLAKGTIQVKKKKITGIASIATTASQIWVVCEEEFSDGPRTVLKVLTQNAREVKVFLDHEWCQVIAGTNHRMYATTKQGVLFVFDTKSLEIVNHFQRTGDQTNQPVVSEITALAIDANLGQLWFACVDGTVTQWDVEVGVHRRTIYLPKLQGPGLARDSIVETPMFVNNLAIVKNPQQPSSPYLWVSSPYTASIFVYNALPEKRDDDEPHREESPNQPTEIEAVLEQHGAPVSAMCAWGPGNTVWTGSDDNSIIVWNTQSFPPVMVKQLRKHNGRISSLCVVGNKIWSGSYDSKVAVWVPETNELSGVVPGVYTSIMHIAVVGMYVWVASKDEMLRVFVSPSLVEDTQRLLNKYNLNSVHEMTEMFKQAVADHECISTLIIKIRKLLQLGNAWYPRNSVPDFCERDIHEHSTLEEVVEGLKVYERARERQQSKVIDTYDLPTHVRSLQSDLDPDSQHDDVYREIQELQHLFVEVEKNLKQEVDRLELECEKRQHDLDQAREELQDAEQQALRLDSNAAEKLSKMESELKQVNDENAKNAKSVQPKVDELTKAKAALAAIEKEIAELRKREAAMKALREKAAEVSKKAAAAAPAPAGVAGAPADDIATARKQLETHQKTIVAKKAELEKASKDLSAVKTATATSTQKVAEKKAALDQQVKEDAQAKAQTEVLTKATADAGKGCKCSMM
eukprot:gnl/Spiro4/16316_TR8762_c1_g1_i1.p1 gnl/Spiro4/16316_TR8762_c1_g1~~gnl/Spiro4/16316_TR8762_c1_g1_i1.p1  ORF type:complete len:769 (-),score=231.32 gnl/Spiro4/16316_TR8762_c1_g1_i1:86-2344(-)